MCDSTEQRKQKYKVGQRIYCQGWGGGDFGTIVEIKWIFHNRLYEYTWGYSCKWENRGPGLTLFYIPEGYLKPAEEKI